MPLDDSDIDSRSRLAPRAPGGRQLAPAGDVGLSVWDPDAAHAHSPAPNQIDLLRYWQIFWKHRVVFFGTVVAALCVAVAVTLLTIPVYTSSTTLQIDREAAKVVNLGDVAPEEQLSQSEEFYQTQYGLLKSRTLAERVVDRLGLVNSPGFIKAAGLKPLPAQATEQARSAYRDKVIRSVMSHLAIKPVRGSRLVNIAFSSRDPGTAAEVVNSFADNFVATNLERRFESSSYAREFLERQLGLAKAKLEESERAASAYAANQQLISLHQGDPNSDKGGSTATESLAEAKLAALNSVYAQATAARIDAEQKWRQAQATPGLALPEVLASPTIQQLSQEKAKLQAAYQDNSRLFKPGYPAQLQLKAQIDELDQRISAEAATIKQAIFAQYSTALHQEQAVAKQVNALKSGVLDFNNRSIQYNVLQREADTNRTLYNALLQRYKDIGVTGSIAANNIFVIDRGRPPLRPSVPKPALNLALGLVLGLGLGVLGAFGVEALDQALFAPADIEAKLGIPLLGAVPLLTKGVTPSEAIKDPRSSFWESYSSIRTALQFSTTAGAPKSLLVVSARPGEGKSTTSTAIATSFARLGARTLLVDSDLRNPSIHASFGLDPSKGLSNYLTGSLALSEIGQSVEQSGLTVIPSGPLPPTPAELLADIRLRQFIAEAEAAYDVVVFDGPPIMGFADAVMISSAVEGTVLVVESGKTGRVQAVSALRRLRMAQGRIMGAVLTKFDSRKVTYGYGSGYEYQYHYGYGEADRPRLSQLKS